MENNPNLAKAMQLLASAQTALKNAEALLSELGGESLASLPKTELPTDTKAYESDENQIVEGYFDGQNMIGPNEKIYPVPANYASKSKMVEGDKLKLTIQPDGRFLYKQIAPIERKTVKGTLIEEDGQYTVITDEGKYKVILASVTYYKGNAGDEVSLIVPVGRSATWGAIDAVIPQVDVDYSQSESF